MIAWWEERTDRERLLLGAGAAVVGLLILVQLVAVPLAQFKSRAEASYVSAQAYLADVEEAVGQVKSMAIRTDTNSQPLDARTLRGQVTDTAAAAGFEVSRLQPGQNGSLTVWIDSAPGQEIMAWLGDVGAQSGIAIGSVSIRQTDGAGRVQTQVTFEPG